MLHSSSMFSSTVLASVARRARCLYHLYPPTVKFHKCLHSTSVLAESAMSSKDCRLVWVDLEMTGLDVTKDHILEMACIITDENLNIVAEGPDIIIHQPDAVLDAMGDWCREHHGKSGLTAASRASTISLADTEEQMLTFVRQHTTQGKCPLAGNTIHMDRRFLDKYMPNFMAHLHYRLVDVSTVKELCRRWYPAEFSRAPVKKLHHRALDDIKESIEELNFYRKTIFQ